MSLIKVWIHAVWSTKGRKPVMGACLEAICQHILENAKTKGIYISEINGCSDHLHCLMCLNPDLSLAKQMQLIKGESSHWINKQGLIAGKFEWADEYYAETVGARQLDGIRHYVRNQEMHHRKISFADEYSSFLRNAGIVGG